MPPRPVLDASHSSEIVYSSYDRLRNRIATYSWNGSLRIWDADRRSQLAVYQAPALGVLEDWERGGRWARVWDPGTGVWMGYTPEGVVRHADGLAGGAKYLYTVPGDGEVHQIAHDDAGGFKALDGAGREVFRLASPEPGWQALSPSNVAIAEDGSWFAAATQRGIVTWRLADRGRSSRYIQLPEGRYSFAVASECDCILIAVGHDDAEAELYRDSLAAPGAAPRRLVKAGSRWAIEIAPGGGAAVLVGPEELALWDLGRDAFAWRRTAATRTVTLSGSSRVTRAHFHADGRRLIAATSAGALLEIDARTGELTAEFGFKPRLAFDVMFRRESLILIDGEIMEEWSLSTGRVQRRSPVRGMDYVQRSVMVDEQGTGFGAREYRLRPFRDATGTTWEVFREDAGCPIGAQALRVRAPDGVRGGEARERVKRWPPRAPDVVACIPDSRILDWNDESGKVLVESSLGAGQTIVDLAAGREVALSMAGAGADLANREFFTLSARGTYVVSTYGWPGEGINVWDATTGGVVGSIAAMDWLNPSDMPMRSAVATSPDERRLARQVGGTLGVFDLPSGANPVILVPPAFPTALEFSTDGRTIFTGTKDGDLLAVRGHQVTGGGYPKIGAVRVVRVSPDGRRVATVHTDGAVRVWDAATVRLAATLYSFADEESIAITPGGAYTGTAEAAARIGWVFSGPTERFDFAQFAATYDDAEMVQARLAGRDVDIQSPRVRPPRIELVGVADRAPAAEGAKLRLRASGAGGVQEVRVFVEGRQVASRAVCAREQELEVEVPLLPGINQVSAIAFDAAGTASNPAAVEISRAGGGASPSLWIVAAGVSAYPKLGPEYQLRYAATDARAIAGALAAAAKRDYAAIHATVLTDGEATAPRILDAVHALSRMKSGDVAVVFLSGHGVKPAADGETIFLTGSSSPAPDGRWDGGLGWNELAAALAGAEGRVVLFLDACHAGDVTTELVVPNNQLAASLVTRGGTFVFAASKGRQQSYEPGGVRGVDVVKLAPAQWTGEHALFTAGVLAALRDPRADRDGDGTLQLSELVNDVTVRVAEVSDGRQTPWVARRGIFGDFGLLRFPATGGGS